MDGRIVMALGIDPATTLRLSDSEITHTLYGARGIAPVGPMPLIFFEQPEGAASVKLRRDYKFP